MWQVSVRSRRPLRLPAKRVDVDRLGEALYLEGSTRRPLSCRCFTRANHRRVRPYATRRRKVGEAAREVDRSAEDVGAAGVRASEGNAGMQWRNTLALCRT